MEIFFGGSFLGGNCQLGIIQVALFRVEVFMLPFDDKGLKLSLLNEVLYKKE